MIKCTAQTNNPPWVNCSKHNAQLGFIVCKHIYERNSNNYLIRTNIPILKTSEPDLIVNKKYGMIHCGCLTLEQMSNSKEFGIKFEKLKDSFILCKECCKDGKIYENPDNFMVKLN